MGESSSPPDVYTCTVVLPFAAGEGDSDVADAAAEEGVAALPPLEEDEGVAAVLAAEEGVAALPPLEEDEGVAAVLSAEEGVAALPPLEVGEGVVVAEHATVFRGVSQLSPSHPKHRHEQPEETYPVGMPPFSHGCPFDPKVHAT